MTIRSDLLLRRLILHSRLGRSLSKAATLVTALLLAAMMLTGCSTARMYSGPAKPLDEVAVLYRQANYVQILSLDGQTLPMTRAKKLELLPGHHAIECCFRAEYMGEGYVSDNSAKGVRLTFEAKPGYTYWVEPNIDPFSKQWQPGVASRPSNSEAPAQ